MDNERLQYEKKLKSTKVSFFLKKKFKRGLPFCEQYYKKKCFLTST